MRIGFDVGGVLASTLEERKIVGPDETEIFRLEPPFEGALEVLCALARVVVRGVDPFDGGVELVHEAAIP